MEYKESAWSEEEFSRNYIEKADIYIAERRKMFGIAASFYRHFFAHRNGSVRILDLGCGDGALSHEFLRIDPSVSVTLVDGSQAMLYRADERLGRYRDVDYMKATFHELLDGSATLGEFDLVASSLAIHHLHWEEKAALFKYIHGHLGHGGRFMNIDVVLAPSGELEGWYFALWREWMEYMQERLGVKDESAEDIITRYKDPTSMNSPDTLEAQLGMLRDAGFLDVDCYYKNGIFTIYGGRNESR